MSSIQRSDPFLSWIASGATGRYQNDNIDDVINRCSQNPNQETTLSPLFLHILSSIAKSRAEHPASLFERITSSSYSLLSPDYKSASKFFDKTTLHLDKDDVIAFFSHLDPTHGNAYAQNLNLENAASIDDLMIQYLVKKLKEEDTTIPSKILKLLDPTSIEKLLKGDSKNPPLINIIADSMATKPTSTLAQWYFHPKNSFQVEARNHLKPMSDKEWARFLINPKNIRIDNENIKKLMDNAWATGFTGKYQSNLKETEKANLLQHQPQIESFWPKITTLFSSIL